MSEQPDLHPHIPTAAPAPASMTRAQLDQQLRDERMDTIGQPAAWAAFGEPVYLQAGTGGSAG